jgi:hypothetical protein
MDLKQLFHNPDSLTDSELSKLRSKIRQQSWMPYFTGVFSGVFLGVIDNQLLGKSLCGKRILAGAAVGYLIGANGANAYNTVLNRSFDREIVNAFDLRFIRHSLNVAGLTSSHTSLAHNEDNHDFSKPY